jgi:DnaK suppressor protein
MRYYITTSSQSSRQQALERLLLENETTLASRRQTLRQELPAAAAEVHDAVELAVDSFTRHLSGALAEVSARTVQKIETALKRMKAGSYGACQDCGTRIPSARLRAMPFADRCRDCQQECDVMGNWGAQPA